MDMDWMLQDFQFSHWISRPFSAVQLATWWLEEWERHCSISFCVFKCCHNNIVNILVFLYSGVATVIPILWGLFYLAACWPAGVCNLSLLRPYRSRRLKHSLKNENRTHQCADRFPLSPFSPIKQMTAVMARSRAYSWGVTLLLGSIFTVMFWLDGTQLASVSSNTVVTAGLSALTHTILRPL